MIGGKTRFTGPDGTQVSTLGKVMAWQRKQMQLAEHFAKRRRADDDNTLSLNNQSDREDALHAASVAAGGASLSGMLGKVPSGPSGASEHGCRGAAATEAPAKRTTLPEYGLSMVEIE